MTLLPLSTARTLALHAQGLTTPNGAEPAPTPDAIYALADRLTCLQIDTLHVVQRSHYVTLWSRLGRYDPADLDRLVYDPDHRRLFEYWYHAASIIPLTEYRYRYEKIEYFRNGGGWWHGWADNPDHRAVIDQVHAQIRAEGARRAADFEHDGDKRGSWWDWKPAKHALEHLYNTGDLMIASRVNFQRVYDLRERVLPGWVDTTPPTRDEAHRHILERAACALGIGEAGHIADYAYMKKGEAAPTIAALVADGVLIEVDVETHGGARTLLVHRDHRPALDRIADGAVRAARTTFLNPFDSLFWAKGRDQLLWGFRQTLEAYRKAPDRVWGYYCLPILWQDRLVGRFDPKLDRKTGTLRLEALYLEPGTAPDDALIADAAAAFRDFLAWHGARTLVIDRSDPAEFGARLLAAL